jgi:hypothetical protein
MLKLAMAVATSVVLVGATVGTRAPIDRRTVVQRHNVNFRSSGEVTRARARTCTTCTRTHDAVIMPAIYATVQGAHCVAFVRGICTCTRVTVDEHLCVCVCDDALCRLGGVRHGVRSRAARVRERIQLLVGAAPRHRATKAGKMCGVAMQMQCSGHGGSCNSES